MPISCTGTVDHDVITLISGFGTLNSYKARRVCLHVLSYGTLSSLLRVKQSSNVCYMLHNIATMRDVPST